MPFVPTEQREGPYYKTCQTCTSYRTGLEHKGSGKCAAKPNLAKTTRMNYCLLYTPMLGAEELPARPSKKVKSAPAAPIIDHMDLAIAEVKAERDATIKRVDEKIKALRSQIHELEESRDSYLRGMEASLDILLRMKGERPKNGKHKEELPDLD